MPNKTIPFILASASPRRRALLKSLGFHPTIVAPKISEKQKHREKPRAYVKRMALEKARAIIQSQRTAQKIWVLAADTVVINPPNQILGKPRNPKEALRFMRLLNGKTHSVLTAFCLGHRGLAIHKWIVKVIVSKVTFRPLTPIEMRGYVNTNDWRDKAGGYGIQDKGSFLVASIQGSFSNIIGLPLETLAPTLRKLKSPARD